MGAPSIDVVADVVRQVSPRKQEENVKSARDGYELVRTNEGAAV